MLELYRGYLISWTGWKPIPNQDYEACQWIGRLMRQSAIPILLHASSPGFEGCHVPGYTFNICLFPGQKPIASQSSPAERKRESKRCKLRLFDLIDWVVDCGLDIAEFEGYFEFSTALSCRWNFSRRQEAV